ncbi:MAG: hypothetical protein ABEJ82_03045 [Haloplanus sp.]
MGMGVAGRLPRPVLERVAETPVTAAETPVYLAAAGEVANVTGAYFRDCQLPTTEVVGFLLASL